MKNILRNSNLGFTKWCFALIAAVWMADSSGLSQTYYDMSSGNYSQPFTGINATWPANWSTVTVGTTGTIPAATKTTVSSANPATVSSSTAIGQDATPSTKLVFLATGSTDNSASTACDLNLNFTGRSAGTLSFDYALIANTFVATGRAATIQVYYSTDGITWAALAGPYTLYNTTGSSTSNVSTGNIVLPSGLNNQPTVKFRFYVYNGGTVVGTPSGNRPKISIDNVVVTSTTASANPEVTSFTPTVGKTGSSVTITGANFGSSTPTVSFNGTAATVSSSSSTSIVVSVPAGATTGKISVTAGGLTAQSLTDFTVDNTAPVVSSTLPVDDASNTSPASLKITFNEAIAKGTGNITIKKTSDNSVVETIAVSATQVTASGLVLTIKPTTSLAYSTGYYVEYDAGIVSDLAGNSLAAGSTGNSAWNFTTRAESPVIITQYYEGLSNNKFIEIANVGGTSLTLTGYSLVLWANADAEGWKNANTYAPSAGSILDLSTVTLAPGQVYVVANSGALLPIAAASANITSNITFFNGNDSVVLHLTGTGVTINDPASVVDAVSFTNSGNEGVDKSFVRTARAPGFSLDSGSNITQFSDVWQTVDLATANAAVSGDNAFLGSTSLATPPALVAFSSGSATVNEDAGTVNLTVVLSAATAAQVTVEVALDSLSTATTADIGDFAARTVTFPAGSAAGSTQTVVVTITNDSEAELSEKAVFKIQNIVGNAVAGAPITSTINIRPSDNAVPNLLISEVPDPSNNGNYRYIELFNPGSTDVDLGTGQWNLVRFSNGGTSGAAIVLTGTVPAGGTFVIATSLASFTEGYPTALTPGLISTQINGNGNDVYALYFGGDNSLGELRDIYGVVGEEGAGTWDYTDKRAVRKSSVVAPNPVWTASEWVVASAASAKMTPGAHPDTAPVITSALTASATVGTAFEYQIAADNNPTVYSAAGLPAQLQFNATTGLISGTPATAETLSVTIEATNGGGTDSKTVVITVGAANSAPTEIGLTATSIAENNAVDAVVGTLSTTDSDVGDSFTYTLVSGTGDANNASFNISGSSLRAGVAFNFEDKSSYSIRVRTTDSANNTFEEVFSITVTDVVEGSTYSSWLGTGTPSDAAFLDYVFGAATPGTLDPSLKPTVAIVPPAGGASGDSATLVLTYYVRQNTVGLTVTPKTSADVAAAPSVWTTVIDDVAVGSPTTRSDGVTVQMRKASVPMIGDRKFLKLEVLQE
jgi:methionine-rich copper-binding protein CopC